MFFKSTLISVRTAAADVRRLEKRNAILLGIVWTKAAAFWTKRTFLKSAERIRTKVRNGTIKAVGTVVERAAETTGFFENEM